MLGTRRQTQQHRPVRADAAACTNILHRDVQTLQIVANPESASKSAFKRQAAFEVGGAVCVRVCVSGAYGSLLWPPGANVSDL